MACHSAASHQQKHRGKVVWCRGPPGTVVALQLRATRPTVQSSHFWYPTSRLRVRRERPFWSQLVERAQTSVPSRSRSEPRCDFEDGEGRMRHDEAATKLKRLRLRLVHGMLHDGAHGMASAGSCGCSLSPGWLWDYFPDRLWTGPVLRDPRSRTRPCAVLAVAVPALRCP